MIQRTVKKKLIFLCDWLHSCVFQFKAAMDGTVGIPSPENLNAVLKSQIMKCRYSMVEPPPSHLKAPKVDKNEDEWHE